MKKKLFGIVLTNWIILIVGYALAFWFGWLLNAMNLYSWGKGITWKEGVMVGWIFGVFISILTERRNEE